MFPHTITIYRHSIEDGADVIRRQILNGVYWYGGTGTASTGKGMAYDDYATIITSPETAAQFGSGWDIEPKDRIMKGENPNITSLSEIPAALTVFGIADNRCGSTVDNITITAR